MFDAFELAHLIEGLSGYGGLADLELTAEQIDKLRDNSPLPYLARELRGELVASGVDAARLVDANEVMHTESAADLLELSPLQHAYTVALLTVLANQEPRDWDAATVASFRQELAAVRDLAAYERKIAAGVEVMTAEVESRERRLAADLERGRLFAPDNRGGSRAASTMIISEHLSAKRNATNAEIAACLDADERVEKLDTNRVKVDEASTAGGWWRFSDGVELERHSKSFDSKLTKVRKAIGIKARPGRRSKN